MQIFTQEAPDIQTEKPAISLALDEVGVCGITRGMILEGVPTTATIDLQCALSSSVRGAHMSRFQEAIDEVLGGGKSSSNNSISTFAWEISERAMQLQKAEGATAAIKATLTREKTTPASGKVSIEPYEVWAHAHVTSEASSAPSTLTFGVSVTGMTACPCAQQLVKHANHQKLIEAGYDEQSVCEILELIPIATHNQRSTGVLELIIPIKESFDFNLISVSDLVLLVEDAMSSETFELLKRSDERAVVEAAHFNARFVEDCVRHLLNAVATHDMANKLPAETVIRVEQVNHESIHSHDVRAAHSATLAQLKV